MLSINQKKQQTKSEATLRKLMLFELDHRGHHPGYLQLLVQYWCAQKLPGHLDVLVSREFAARHPEIVNLENNQPRVKFILITPAEQAQLFDSYQLEASFTGRIKRAFQEYRLLSRYTKALGTTHCFLMYLDKMLLRLALSSKLSCRFSCIYFRPIFHYTNFANYTLANREKIWHWRDKVCLSRLLKSSSLDTLFCLDPLAIKEINKLGKTSKAVHLPDPAQTYLNEDSQLYLNNDTRLKNLKTSLGIDSTRKVFLLFGDLSERKGFNQLLEAINLIPIELSQKMCFLFVGSMQAHFYETFQVRTQQISQSLPVQIISNIQYIPEEDIQNYFQISDVILAPYQRHIGMSGILVRSAAAQKPILSSDFGLMGEITRLYELGVTVDSSIPAQISKGLCRFLQTDPINLCNPSKMNQFAQMNQAEQFAEKIFNVLTSEHSSSRY